MSATAADMFHDPAKAQELNARNLKGNGIAMTAEGQAMADPGQEMTTQVEQLRETGDLAPDLATQFIAAGQEMVETGEALRRDGQRMQDVADDMLVIIGG